jgi:tetratricopeptide (TPR) repeat protein
MAFRGDLSNINLASVLQNLLHNEQTGTLRLFDDEREAYLHFDGGHVTMFSPGREARTPLAEYLARAGDATEKQLAAASKRARGKRTLTSVLSRMGIEEQKIRSAVRRFVEEEVCDLFTWDSGRFEFSEGAPAEDLFDPDMNQAGIKLGPNTFILEAARRADTWDQINRQIRSDAEIFVLRKEAAESLESDFDPGVVEVARLLDGRRSVTQLAEESGLGRFPVMSALSQLIAKGAARPVSLTEVLGLAETALGRREFGEAVRFYRRALEIERNNLECRQGLIEALEGAGDRTEASTERKLLAATFHGMGRFEDASEELRKAIEDAPTDITAREKHIALLREMGATRAVEAANMELGRTYLSLGIAEKARKVFEAVLKDRPHDPARVALTLADACVNAGDVPAAVEAYRKAIAQYITAEEYNAAAGACEEILKLQPDNATAKKRLEEINSGKLLRRKRRWRIVKYAFVFAAMLVLGIAWLVYDWFARDHLDAMSAAAISRLEADDFEGAAECYAVVGEQYPFTRAALSASRMRAALSERMAVRLLGEARKHREAGRTGEALKCLARAEKLSPSAGTLEQVRAARRRLAADGTPPGARPESAPPAGE